MKQNVVHERPHRRGRAGAGVTGSLLSARPRVPAGNLIETRSAVFPLHKWKKQGLLDLISLPKLYQAPARP